jgi:hypothetical protein
LFLNASDYYVVCADGKKHATQSRKRGENPLQMRGCPGKEHRALFL